MWRAIKCFLNIHESKVVDYWEVYFYPDKGCMTRRSWQEIKCNDCNQKL